MQRRQVLVALAALLPAGCLGAKRPETAAAVRTEGGSLRRTPTPTPEPTPTATPEPTETPTPEPTETPEPGPSDEAIDAGAEAISRVQSAFVESVEAYTGDDDGTLTEVSVTSRKFDVRTVLLSIDTIQRELTAAETAAVTDDQRATVADLRTAEQFLTQSALVQSYAIETVDRLDAVRAAFADGIDEVEDAESRFETTLKRASDGITTLKNDVDADAVSAAEPFDDDTYDETVSRFDAVRAVFRDADSGLNRMMQGLDDLEDAHDDEEDGDDDDAEEKAESARDYFDEAYDFFDDAADAADDVGSEELESIMDALRERADDRYVEADDLYEDVS